MARMINVNGASKARVTQAVGKAKAAAKPAVKVTAKKRGRIEYKFADSLVYGALKYLAENDLIGERDADFALGLAKSIVDGQRSDRRFFYAKKLCMKASHRDALIELGFDMGALMQEQYVAPKKTAADFVTITGVFGGMSQSGAAFRFKVGGRRLWLPLSQVVLGKTGLPNEDEQVTLKVAKWLAEKNNIQAA